MLVSRDEDPNVSYTLQYEGMWHVIFVDIVGAYRCAELVVRSTQLLLMIEDWMDKPEVGNTGKAIVIVS